MIESMYPLTFIAATSLLIAWTFFNRQQLWPSLWRGGFFLSMIIYLGSFFLGTGTLEDKFAWLFRDMMLLAGVGGVFQLLVRNTAAFLIGLFMTIGGFIWLYESNWFTQPKEPESFNQLDTRGLEKSTALESLAKDGEWLVELSPGKTAADLNALLKNYELLIQRAFQPEDEAITELDDYFVVDVLDDDINTIYAVKNILDNIPFVDWVEGNDEVSVSPIPATTQRSVNPKFGIDDPEVGQLWGFDAMKVDQLYSLIDQEDLKPKKRALIAILDTGVDAQHEDLKGNYQSTQKKYDRDTKMHGTHCAGIAAAVSNNGVGIASFSPNQSFVKITSIKVLSDFGMGTQQGIIKGMIEAADKGADVISMSLGGRSNQARQTAYAKAVDYANKKGAIVIAAAGNSNLNAKDYSPVNTPGVIGVSAIDVQLNRATFSNFVPNIKMAVAAPGVNIYSTTPNDTYASFNGTSMATPYVAGLVGLMKSLKPNLTAQDAHRILNKTGINTKDTRMTGKLIQPYAAIKMLLN